MINNKYREIWVIDVKFVGNLLKINKSEKGIKNIAQYGTDNSWAVITDYVAGELHPGTEFYC